MKKIFVDASNYSSGISAIVQGAKIYADKTKSSDVYLVGEQKDLTLISDEPNLHAIFAHKEGEAKSDREYFITEKAIEEMKKAGGRILVTFTEPEEIRALAETEFSLLSTPCFVTYFLSGTPNRYCLLGDCGYHPSLTSEQYLDILKEMKKLASNCLFIPNPTTTILAPDTNPDSLPDAIRDAYDALEGKERFNGLTPFKDIMNGKSDIFLTNGYTSKAIIDSYLQCYRMYENKFLKWKKDDFRASLAFFFGKAMIKDVQRLTTAKLDATGSLLLGFDHLVLKVAANCTANEFVDVLRSAERYLDYFKNKK